jgi:hypothetical protein
LVYGSPEIVPFAMDGQEHFVQMPRVTKSRAPSPQLIGIDLPELPAPIAHRFVRQDDAALRHQRFDIPVAQAEATGEPDTVTDNLRREPMAFI